MVKIRLRRVGTKKQASFRVVIADSRAPRDGRFIEKIGFYNPRTEPETLRIDEARALYWLQVGAQPTESVMRLLKTKGTLARFERLRQGEELEALVAEAEAEEEEEAAAAAAAAEEEDVEVEEAQPIEEETEAETEAEAEAEETAEETEAEEATEETVEEEDEQEETTEPSEDEAEEEPEADQAE